MKIGILTLPLHTNYGGILQAYALQTVLERIGHEVVVFDTDKHRSLQFSKMPLIYSKRILKNVLGRKCEIFPEQKWNREYPVISQYTQPFIGKHIHRLVINDLRKLNEKDFDTIVVGSDQIWRPIYYPNIANAFLDFAKGWNIKRLSYAVSFGTDKWEYTEQQTNICKELIKKFHAISVREDSGIRLCEEHFNMNAVHVLDPTMLLTADDYISLFKCANTPKSKGNLLVYVLDENKEKSSFIENLAKEKKLQPFRVNSKVEDHNAPLNERIQPPVEQWLHGFYNAEFVITDSFHASVFSILFQKQFVVIGNKKRGLSRFSSLLKMFGLEDRLVTDTKSITALRDIDYQLVNNKLQEKKEYSLSFLINKLNR